MVLGMSFYDDMTVTLPEGTCGDTAIRRFTVERDNLARVFSNSYGGRGRGLRQGDVYTGLYRKGELWMSDTPDEKYDHAEALHQAHARQARRVLINGLGLGMVVKALLNMEHVEHIDVVDIDPNVIALVAGHYAEMAAAAGKTLTVHEGDAYTIKWPVGTRWEIAWHDIWVDLSTENLPGMTLLHRRYGHRVAWQGSWGKELLLRRRKVEREEDRRYELFAQAMKTRRKS